VVLFSCELPSTKQYQTPSSPTEGENVKLNQYGLAVEGAFFPHPKNWALPEVHGKEVIDRGFTQCTKCHGAALQGNPPSVSACSSCHEGMSQHYDMTAWVYRAEHQLVYQENPANCTKRCHGVDLRGGDTGKSCFKCHTTFPHRQFSTNFLKSHSKKLDGSAVNFKSDCASNCHGQDLSKIRKGADGQDRNCFTCHKEVDFPGLQKGSGLGAGIPFKMHMEVPNWKDPSVHGKEAARVGLLTCAKPACHGGGLGGNSGNKAPQCASCHQKHSVLTQHLNKTTWWTGTERLHPHEFKKDPSLCQSCHGQTLEGGPNVQISCKKCHMAYPHEEGWLTQLKHPAFVNEKMVDAGKSKADFVTDNCTGSCHGADFTVRKGKGIKDEWDFNCTACHAIDTSVADKPFGHRIFKFEVKAGNVATGGLGVVNFDHPEHQKRANMDCSICHDPADKALPAVPQKYEDGSLGMYVPVAPNTAGIVSSTCFTQCHSDPTKVPLPASGLICHTCHVPAATPPAVAP
jgi:hypothetical protein